MRIPRRHSYSRNALERLDRLEAAKAANEQELKATEKAAKRKAKAELVEVQKDPNCSVCLKPTRNFNARINVRRDDGGLLALGICGD